MANVRASIRPESRAALKDGDEQSRRAKAAKKTLQMKSFIERACHSISVSDDDGENAGFHERFLQVAIAECGGCERCKPIVLCDSQLGRHIVLITLVVAG